jgi:enoyl-CoA hydratase/carnithine racemase
MAEGNTFDYNEAEAMGLINRQIEADDEAGFMEAVFEWARTFTPPAAASGAIGLIKRAVQSGADLPLESGLALERELQARLFMGGDASEGIDAFKGKRPPHFTGQ